jgi:hypothetical protein
MRCYDFDWHVRFESLADIEVNSGNVRFTPRKRTFGGSNGINGWAERSAVIHLPRIGPPMSAMGH